MGQCAHSIAQFQCCAALANRDYLAGHFQSWYGGRVLRRRIKPEALQQVGAIDTGMIHFNQHLLRTGRGCRVGDNRGQLRRLEVDEVSVHGVFFPVRCRTVVRGAVKIDYPDKKISGRHRHVAIHAG